jgi:hypothetical protein
MLRLLTVVEYDEGKCVINKVKASCKHLPACTLSKILRQSCMHSDAISPVEAIKAKLHAQ